MVPLPTSTPRACVLCERLLDWRAALTPRKAVAATSPELYPLCQDFTCRMEFEQRGDMSAADFRRHLEWRAQILRDRRARARLRQERNEAEYHQADAVFAALAPRTDLGTPPDLRLVAPSGHAPLRPLSQRRRRAHIAHLEAIIAAALKRTEPIIPAAPGQPTIVQPAPGPEAGPEVGAADSRFPERLCGVCGGGCCAGGGNHAYLSEATIQRVVAANPDLDFARLRAAYLGHLAQRTIPGSCVHHTRAGCSLPRSLRSDICNSYACETLKHLQISLQAKDPPVRKVVVLRRRQNQWKKDDPELNNDIIGAAVLTEATTTRLRPPKPGGWTMGMLSAEASQRPPTSGGGR